MAAECHNIDITNGVASFATARIPAWHRLGTVFDRAMTVPEAMAAANLAGWNVRKLDLFGREVVNGDDGVDTTVEVAAPRWALSVRDNPVTGEIEPFGPVGTGFTHVQNEEQAEFLSALLDESGAFIETAGALKGGAHVFYTAKLPQTMMIGGVDAHDLYVVVMNGHDGSLALRTIATPIRVVCRNTQLAALRAARAEWSIRHTPKASRAVDEARRALDLTFQYNDAFQAAAERMINEAMTAGEFEAIVKDVFAAEDEGTGPRAERNRIERFDTIRGLWEAPTQAAIAGTRWAGYNAVTEWVDHYRTTTGKGDEAKAVTRATAAVAGGSAVKFKTRAFAALAV